ncbi:MAG TPA: hypothetical protein VMT37_03650 [Solirubrobacterales bacterium]|nr:hypothetical protein [Solirubrobacterales bacterium]
MDFRGWLALLVAALALLLAGCGSGEQSGTTASEAATTASEGGADGLLLSPAVFTKLQPTKGASLTEPCRTAAAILAPYHGHSTVTPVFALRQGTLLKETVTTFPSFNGATAGFFGVISEARERCIERELAKQYPGGSVTRVPLPAQHLVQGEALRRYLVGKPGATPSAELDLFVLQGGPCVVAIVASSSDGPADKMNVKETAWASAHQILADPRCSAT